MADIVGRQLMLSSRVDSELRMYVRHTGYRPLSSGLLPRMDSCINIAANVMFRDFHNSRVVVNRLLGQMFAVMYGL